MSSPSLPSSFFVACSSDRVMHACVPDSPHSFSTLSHLSFSFSLHVEIEVLRPFQCRSDLQRASLSWPCSISRQLGGPRRCDLAVRTYDRAHSSLQRLYACKEEAHPIDQRISCLQRRIAVQGRVHGQRRRHLGACRFRQRHEGTQVLSQICTFAFDSELFFVDSRIFEFNRRCETTEKKNASYGDRTLDLIVRTQLRYQFRQLPFSGKRLRLLAVVAFSLLVP